MKNTPSFRASEGVFFMINWDGWAAAGVPRGIQTSRYSRSGRPVLPYFRRTWATPV